MRALDERPFGARGALEFDRPAPLPVGSTGRGLLVFDGDDTPWRAEHLDDDARAACRLAG
jgi:hypothetical protein